MQVMHSQSIRQAPTQPWPLVTRDGGIITGNCDCKAGLGSTCTHVAALLFRVEAAVRIRETKTVTQEKAYWLLPTCTKEVTPAPVCDIDFSSAKKRRQLFAASVKSLETACTAAPCVTTSLVTTPVRPSRDVPRATDAEATAFLSQLAATGRRSAILSITAPFNTPFIPRATSNRFPSSLDDFKADDCLHMSRSELTDYCNNLMVTVSTCQAVKVEKATRAQASCKLWFRYRTGRVTASRMKAVCATNVTKPSVSLIKAICYPEAMLFKSAATTWGCDHEREARTAYLKDMMTQHTHFEIRESGLVINPDYPCLGATPDGIVSCDCCGTGVVELKCPYCAKSATDHSCLTTDSSNCTTLKHSHQYYYQVQTQLFVCDVTYADFVVWVAGKFHHERIFRDDGFWEDICLRAQWFFHNVILLELTGRFFTRLAVADSAHTSLGK